MKSDEQLIREAVAEACGFYGAHDADAIVERVIEALERAGLLPPKKG